MRIASKAKRAVIGNEAEQTLAYQALSEEIEFEQNYVFAPARKFQLDLAVPEQRCGVEIEGGIWSAGAHGRPNGILRDMEKHNLLITLGWRVLRFTPTQVQHGEAIEGLKAILVRKIL